MKKIIHRFLPLLAAILLAPTSTWAFSGTGLVGSPFKITNYTDLKDFATAVNGGAYDGAGFADGVYVDLESDIVLSGDFVPIGVYDEHPFQGHFNGNGHKISGNITVNGDYVGLFGYVAKSVYSINNPEIYDLTLENIHVTCTGSNVGSLAGYIAVGDVRNITYSGTNTVTATGTDRKNISGVIGYMGNGSLENIALHNMTVDGNDNTQVGAIAGYLTPSVASHITNCTYDIHTTVKNKKHTTAHTYWDARKANSDSQIASYGVNVGAGIAIGTDENSAGTGAWTFDLKGKAFYKTLSLVGSSIDNRPYYYNFGEQLIPTWTSTYPTVVAGEIHLKDDGIEIPHNIYQALTDPEDITTGDVTSIVKWSDNIEPGTAKGTFTLRNGETLDLNFTILKYNITDPVPAVTNTTLTYTINPTSVYYRGTAYEFKADNTGDIKVQTFQVAYKKWKEGKIGEETEDAVFDFLSPSTLGTNWEIVAASGTDKGTYNATVNGIGSRFEGTRNLTWEILALTLTQDLTKLGTPGFGYVTFDDITGLIYNGDAKEPDFKMNVHLTDQATTNFSYTKAQLTTPGDYTYTNNTHAWETVEQHGNNKPTVTVTALLPIVNCVVDAAGLKTNFIIARKEITEVAAQYVWNITPAFGTYDFDGKTHKPVVTIEDQTIYLGPSNIPAAEYDEGWKDAQDQTYTGTMRDVTRKADNSVGSYTWTLTAKTSGNYKGTFTKTVTINPVDFATVTIEDIADITYDATEHHPNPVVKLGTEPIIVQGDFSSAALNVAVTYTTDCTNVGTKTITLTSDGTKNFNAGTKTKDFKIVKADLTVKLLVDETTYNRNVQTYNADGTKVTITGVKGTDNITFATFTVKYDGAPATDMFPVAAKSSYKVTLELPDQTPYNNYTLKFKNALDADITEVDFTINKKNISNATQGTVAVNLDQTGATSADHYPYKGSDWTPAQTIAWTHAVDLPNAPKTGENYNLVVTTEYKLYESAGKTYFTDAACTSPAANTTDAGTYYFKVQGQGDNYEGELVKSFVVEKVSIRPYEDDTHPYAGKHDDGSGNMIDNVRVTYNPDFTFNGQQQGPAIGDIVVERWFQGTGWKTLTGGTDYDFIATNAFTVTRGADAATKVTITSNDKPIHAGNVVVKIEGKGNYIDENEQTTYEIKPRNVSTLTDAETTFTLNKGGVNTKVNPTATDITLPNGPQQWNYDGTVKEPSTVTIQEITVGWPAAYEYLVEVPGSPVANTSYDFSFTNEMDQRNNTIHSTNVKREGGAVDGAVQCYEVTISTTDYGNYTGTKKLYYRINPVSIGGGTVDGYAPGVLFEPEGSQAQADFEKTYATADFDDLWAPVSLRSNYSESVMYYTAAELATKYTLNADDEIVALSFPGFNDVNPTTAKINAWYEWTDDASQAKPADGMYVSGSMTQIADETSFFAVKGTKTEPEMLYTIYFATPIKVQAGKNLRIVMNSQTDSPVLGGSTPHGVSFMWDETAGQSYWHWANDPADFATSAWAKLRMGAPVLSFRKKHSPLLVNQEYQGKPIADKAPRVVSIDGGAAAETSDIAVWTYKNSETTHDIIVKMNGVKLVEGTDYKVDFKDNKWPTTETTKATITITGIGNLENSFMKLFEIEKMKIWGVDIVNVKVPEVDVLLDHDAPIHIGDPDYEYAKQVVLYGKDPNTGYLVQLNHNTDPTKNVEGAEAWVEWMTWADENGTDRTGWNAKADHKYTVTAKVWLGHDEDGVAYFSEGNRAFKAAETAYEHTLPTTTWTSKLFEFGGPLDMSLLKINGKGVNSMIPSKRNITMDYTFILTAGQPEFVFNPESRRLGIKLLVNKEDNVNTYLEYRVNDELQERIEDCKAQLDAANKAKYESTNPADKAYYTYELPAFRVNSVVEARVVYQKPIPEVASDDHYHYTSISKVDEVSLGKKLNDTYYITAAPAVGQIGNLLYAEQIDAQDKLASLPDAVRPTAQIKNTVGDNAGYNVSGAKIYYIKTVSDTDEDEFNVASTNSEMPAAIDWHYDLKDNKGYEDLADKTTQDTYWLGRNESTTWTLTGNTGDNQWTEYDPANPVDLTADPKYKYTTYYFIAKVTTQNTDENALFYELDPVGKPHYAYSEITKYRAENMTELNADHEWKTYYAKEKYTDYDGVTEKFIEGYKVIGADVYNIMTANANTNTLTVSRPDVMIPAEQPVLLRTKNDGSKIYLSSLRYDANGFVNYADEAAFKALTATEFVGSEVETAPDFTTYDYFVLNNEEFVKVNSTEDPASKIPAHRSWLQFAAGSYPALARFAIVFDEADAIDAAVVETMKQGDWFDLNGRKLDNVPTRKGVYIFNGRKVVIK